MDLKDEKYQLSYHPNHYSALVMIYILNLDPALDLAKNYCIPYS